MELWDIYTKDREKSGRIHRRGEPMAEGDYHLVVRAWIRNGHGDILLTQRQKGKTYPLYWEAPGGSVLKGEESLDGVVREVYEETGISLRAKTGKKVKEERHNCYFYDVWLFNADISLSETRLQTEEVCDIQWVTPEELDELFTSGKILPSLHYYKEIITK